MAEVLIRYQDTISGPRGEAYVARACGRLMDEHRWEGWIEFDPGAGRPVLRTRRETVQPNHEDLLYWATGLTDAYLEGALERALHPTAVAQPARAPDRPAYDGPAPDTASHPHRPVDRPHAILDPFHAYEQGEEVLRGQLHAMEAMHLRNIVRAYDLLPPGDMSIDGMDAPTLAAIILAGVRERERAGRKPASE